MCWSNNMVTPIVLKKPLIVYKIGMSTTSGNFISLYQDFIYYKSETVPTVEINPGFERYFSIIPISALWTYDTFYIHKGYHSYLTETMAKYKNEDDDDIGIFEIPAGATIYVNYRHREVVSTDIKYLGLLEL